MKDDRFKFGVCHAYMIDNKVVTGGTVNPAVYYRGYPTRDKLEK